MRKSKMQTIVIYLVAALVLLGIAYFTVWFPAGLVIKLFLPTVTQAELEANPYQDFSGWKAGADIPRLEGMSQYEDGTYTLIDFVTVETSEVVLLEAYRLKDPADVNNTSVYLNGRRAFTGPPLEKYTPHPKRRKYLYGRYYLLGLSDGSYVAAYADQSYGALYKAGSETVFPIGRLRRTSAQEKAMLEKGKDGYAVDTERVLYMMNDERVSDFKFWDLAIRAAAAVLFMGVLAVVVFTYLKFAGVRRK